MYTSMLYIYMCVYVDMLNMSSLLILLLCNRPKLIICCETSSCAGVGLYRQLLYQPVVLKMLSRCCKKAYVPWVPSPSEWSSSPVALISLMSPRFLRPHFHFPRSWWQEAQQVWGPEGAYLTIASANSPPSSCVSFPFLIGSVSWFPTAYRRSWRKLAQRERSSWALTYPEFLEP